MSLSNHFFDVRRAGAAQTGNQITPESRSAAIFASS
jgi:hypothetical protein